MTLRLFIFIFVSALPLLGDFYINAGKKQNLYPIKENRSFKMSKIRYYIDANGKKLGVSKDIIICFDENKTIDEDSFAKKFDISFVKRLSENMFLYKTKNSSKTLQIANNISQEAGVKFAQPDFLIKKERRTADPYYEFLWHLKNNEYEGADINVEEAWRYTKGEGVKTAVIDEGIDIDHNDLRENIIGFANFNDPNSNYPGSKSGKWHGTACAGLLCSSENDTGVVGVAPASKLYAVRYSDSKISQDIAAFDYLMKKGVSVISNSWGSYRKLDSYEEIFKTLATKGRDGKGILIFFAAGNDSRSLDDSGINDESESEFVISIGSSTHKDTIASYSNYGSSLDFLAPGGIMSGQLVTTDAMGEKGYTDWNYNFNFIGTSASAPIAAGVAALMLSANPDLTRDEVIDILAKTAKKIGDYPYINGKNIHAGYGRIDAGKAVKMAKYYHMKPSFSKSNMESFVHTIYRFVVHDFDDRGK